MSLLEGSLLQDRYKIEALLGRGGMGAVFRAIDTRLGSVVAIKQNLFEDPASSATLSQVTRPEDTEARRQQFENEARLLASLKHTGLPRVTDYFFVPGEGQYLVMEFVEGQDFGAVVSQLGPLREPQAVGFIIEIARVLEYLHGQRPPIIHRDIKPTNIRVTPHGQVFLVDFGVAKIGTGEKTFFGAQAVTPGYSPLEQFGGDQPTDERSDIYSLSATLYTLAAGTPPPSAIDLLRGKPLFEPTGPASLLSPELKAALEKGMQLEPVDRFASAREFCEALEGLVPNRTRQAYESDTARLVTQIYTQRPSAIDMGVIGPTAAGQGTTGSREAARAAMSAPTAAAATMPMPGAPAAEHRRGGSRKVLGLIVGGLGAVAVIAIATTMLMSKAGRQGPVTAAVSGNGEATIQAGGQKIVVGSDGSGQVNPPATADSAGPAAAKAPPAGGQTDLAAIPAEVQKEMQKLEATRAELEKRLQQVEQRQSSGSAPAPGATPATPPAPTAPNAAHPTVGPGTVSTMPVTPPTTPTSPPPATIGDVLRVDPSGAGGAYRSVDEALQAHYAAGGARARTIELAPGRHVIASETILHSPLSIIGSGGPGAVTLEGAPAGALFRVRGGPVEIRNVSLNSAGRYAVLVLGQGRLTMTDCRMQGGSGAVVAITETGNLTLRNCAVTGGSVKGLLADKMATVSIEGGRIEGNGTGVQARDGARVRITGGSVQNNTENGLYALEGGSIDLSGGEVSHNGSNGATAKNGSLNLSNARLIDNGGFGVACLGTSNVSRVGLTLTGNRMGEASGCP